MTSEADSVKSGKKLLAKARRAGSDRLPARPGVEGGGAVRRSGTDERGDLRREGRRFAALARRVRRCGRDRDVREARPSVGVSSRGLLVASDPALFGVLLENRLGVRRERRVACGRLGRPAG
jgi:hypothetical protein